MMAHRDSPESLAASGLAIGGLFHGNITTAGNGDERERDEEDEQLFHSNAI
jgi:hypothetical protein